jgi:hypothetical protein
MSVPVRPTSQKKERNRKPQWSPGRDDFDPRSLIAGVILAAIVWPLFVLILWAASLHLGRESVDPAFQQKRQAPSFDINLVPDEFIMPQKPVKKPSQFVETNPDAPENIPDDTTNFGARNQQAAQEKPNPDAHGDRAATEGKKDFESNQIVSGQLTPPQEAPPPEPPPTPEVAQAIAQAQAQAQKEQNPLSGFEKRLGDNPDGVGMNDAKPAENTSNVDKKVEGQKDSPLTVGTASPAMPQIDPRKPQPRKYVDKQRVRPAIFAENRVGTSNIGIAGFDSRWSNYGGYLQRMVDAVQMQFDRLNDESRIMPPTGTVVTVHFRMNKKGEITEILDSNSTGGSQAESLCKTAITTRAPYGEWTDDMVAMLGESQDFTWRFYYGTP